VSAAGRGPAAAGPARAGWRVEIERPGCGVHLVADQAAAVRLADAAPGNVWVEPADDVADGEVLDAAGVDRVIAERRW
jgi:hypothetical protein